MKNLIILIIIVAGVYQLWGKYVNSVSPRFEGSYISVYGRDSCGYTKRLLSKLTSERVKFHYFSVDDKANADDLHLRMEASGISTRRYNLPVVDVSGDITVRPKFRDVLTNYRT